jgi:hypothetical protein
MNKKATTTAVILLAVLIAIGGWILTSRLMDAEADRLLSEVTYIPAGTPTVEIYHEPLQLNEVRVIVNGEILEQLGIVQDGMLMLPIHAIAEAFGEIPTDAPEFAPVRDIMEHFSTNVNWDSATQTIYIYDTTLTD